MRVRLMVRLAVCPVTLHFSGRWTMVLPTLGLLAGVVALLPITAVCAWTERWGALRVLLDVTLGIEEGMRVCRWLLVIAGGWAWWVSKEWRVALHALGFALLNKVLAVAVFWGWMWVTLCAAPEMAMAAAQLTVPRGVEVWHPVNHPRVSQAQAATNTVFTLSLETPPKGALSHVWKVRARWPEPAMLEVLPLKGEGTLFGPEVLPTEEGEALTIDGFSLQICATLQKVMSGRRHGADAVIVRVFPKDDPKRTLLRRCYLLTTR